MGLPKRIPNLRSSCSNHSEKLSENSLISVVMKKETSGPVLRPLSPGGRFPSPISSSSPASFPFATSTNFGFSSGSSTFFHDHRHDDHHHHRSASPTRVNLSSTPLSHSVRFSIDHRSSSKRNGHAPISVPKKSCMCSPTTHPGSFRCSLHKNSNSGGHAHHQTSSYPSTRLNMLRSAMTNSLVRIGGVEGDWVKRALTALIRPSSHQLRRRANFQPRPSRLSVMSKAEDR